MGARSYGPLRSRVPAFLDFIFAFQRYGMKFFFAFPCALAFLFRVLMLLQFTHKVLNGAQLSF